MLEGDLSHQPRVAMTRWSSSHLRLHGCLWLNCGRGPFPQRAVPRTQDSELSLSRTERRQSGNTPLNALLEFAKAANSPLPSTPRRGPTSKSTISTGSQMAALIIQTPWRRSARIATGRSTRAFTDRKRTGSSSTRFDREKLETFSACNELTLLSRPF